MIRVADSGEGILPPKCRIFSTDFFAAQERPREGSGLGLEPVP